MDVTILNVQQNSHFFIDLLIFLEIDQILFLYALYNTN